MPDHPTYRSHVLDHLGLVAGMFDELSLGDIMDHATQQHPDMRDLTVGEAVNAMVLNGLGCIKPARYLVPRCFQKKPTSRRLSPRVSPEQLNDEALGRALDTRDDDGVSERYRLIAATAAKRLGLSPTDRPLESTSVHVDGRDTSDEPPAEHVVHLTTGASREQRPDLNHVMWAWIVAHQAGSPVRMKPRSGHRRDPPAFGPVIHAAIDP
jgi:transposase